MYTIYTMEYKCIVCGRTRNVPPSMAKKAKYCSVICRTKILPPPDRSVPIGTKHKMGEGYIEIKTENGWVLEHIFIMEKIIGRKINHKKEIVHHINHIRDDNRLENLQLFKRGDHIWLHRKENLFS